MSLLLEVEHDNKITQPTLSAIAGQLGANQFGISMQLWSLWLRQCRRYFIRWLDSGTWRHRKRFRQDSFPPDQAVPQCKRYKTPI